GAMRYAYPSVPELGLRLKTMLGAYREADGVDALVVFHDRKGEDWLLRRAHRQGLPANLIPVGVHDLASIGPDLLLAALCYGAAHVSVLQAADMPAAYGDNLRRQITLVHSLLEGFGYPGEHCSVLECLDGQAEALPSLPAQPMALPAASFNL